MSPLSRFEKQGSRLDEEMDGSGLRPTSPTAAACGQSSPSDSEEDSSTTSSSSCTTSSGASSFSDTSGGMFAAIDNERVKPFVVDIENMPEDTSAQQEVKDEAIYFNVDTLAASPLNLKASHSITIQRRFDFLVTPTQRVQDPNTPLTKIFQYLHSVLRMKVAQLGKCVVASYKSEVMFASDNDINIRLIGYILLPADNRMWYRNSVSTVCRRS